MCMRRTLQRSTRSTTFPEAAVRDRHGSARQFLQVTLFLFQGVSIAFLATNTAGTSAAAELPIEVLAIRDNGRSLINGKVTARGSFRYEASNGRSEQSVDQAVDCDEVLEFAFDHATNRSSFRRTRRRTRGEDFPHLDDFEVAGLIATPQYSLQIAQSRGSKAPSVGVYEPIVDPKRIPRYLAPLIDLRVVSLATYDNLSGPFDAYTQFLESDTVKVIPEGGGITRIEGQDESRQMYRYWTDERSGHQVIRHQTTQDEQAYLSRRLPVPVVAESETAWTSINGVWVPRSLTLRSTSRQSVTRLDLTFDWQSVNQGVSDDDFQWENWALPPGAFVVDQRLGRDQPIYLRDYSLPDEVALAAPPRAQTVRTQRFLILINVIAAGLLTGWLVRTWRRNRTNPSS